MPRAAVYRSKAFFPSMVASAVASFCKCTYPSRVYWSTNMVAYLYRFLVRKPVICAIKPGVDNTSWSTDTISPGFVAGVLSGPFLRGLFRHARLVAFANMHAEQHGMGQFAKRFGRIPALPSPEVLGMERVRNDDAL